MTVEIRGVIRVGHCIVDEAGRFDKFGRSKAIQDEINRGYLQSIDPEIVTTTKPSPMEAEEQAA